MRPATPGRNSSRRPDTSGSGASVAQSAPGHGKAEGPKGPWRQFLPVASGSDSRRTGLRTIIVPPPSDSGRGAMTATARTPSAGRSFDPLLIVMALGFVVAVGALAYPAF